LQYAVHYNEKADKCNKNIPDFKFFGEEKNFKGRPGLPIRWTGFLSSTVQMMLI